MGKQLPCGECGCWAYCCFCFGADVVDVDRLVRVVMRASFSEEMHTMGAEILWWVIVLLFSWTMSMLISCQMMSETT